MDITDIVDFIWQFLKLGIRHPAKTFLVSTIILCLSGAGLWFIPGFINQMSAATVIVSYIVLAIFILISAISFIGSLIGIVIHLMRGGITG